MYKYKFIGKEPVYFPQQGIEAKNGDVLESEQPLFSALLEEIIEESVKSKDEKPNVV